MRILYDGAITQEHGVGGVKRYFNNLIKRLPLDFQPHFTSCRAESDRALSHPQLRVHRFRRFRPQRASVKLEKMFFGRVQDHFAFDIAHPTYYTLLSQREVRDYPYPVVITVWDMIHELFPNQFPDREFVLRKRSAIEAADVVICISENTRQDLVEFSSVDESKIFVTHLAPDFELDANEHDVSMPTRPYLLYVGARAGYKNFDGLLLAFAAATRLNSEMVLRVVGTPFTGSELKRIEELRLKGRVENCGLVSDDQLISLYRSSVAFVYPSLYEGFGIPLLEAMQCGTPVLASNRSSIPEVVGDAAMLFDPEQPDELANILISVASDSSLRTSLIARGHERARQFSWDKTARETVDIYRKLAKA